MADFTFNPETHEYFVDKVKYPSVSEIIKSAGISDFSNVRADVLEAACKFGKAVHKATELWDAETLNEAKLSEPLKPYLECWKRFVVDYKVKVLWSERQLYSPLWKFAGTLDRVAEVNGKMCILDIKTSKSLYPSVAIQTAAYKKLWEDNFKDKEMQIKKRYCVRLTEKLAKVDQLKEKTDESVFLSALQLYRFRERNRLL